MNWFKNLLILLVMMVFTMPLYAAEPDPGTGTNYTEVFATFAALVAAIPFIMEAVKRIIPAINNSSLAVQIVSWVVGIAVTMFGWWMDLGYLAGLDWWIALLYGLGASLAANGIFDTGFIEWFINLFKAKKE